VWSQASGSSGSGSRLAAFDLVDEVADCGDHVLVKNGSQIDRVEWSNMAYIREDSGGGFPPRITIRLVRPGKFGREIAFLPRGESTLNPFAQSRTASELRHRLQEARSDPTV
jgi:hypothetical protein